MSDVSKPIGSEDQSTIVPHSGNLPDSLREDHPTGDFDNTPLEEPHGTDALTAPDSPATLPELMPPVTEQESAPTAQESTKSRLWLKIGAPLAALVALGGSFFIGRNSGDDQNNVRNGPAVFPPTTAQEYTPPTINPLAEQLDEEYAKPHPAITNNPQEILDALFYNLDGYLNTGNEDCLKFYVYNPTDVKSGLLQVLQKQRSGIEDYQRAVVIYKQVAKPLLDGEPDYSDPNSPTIPVKVSTKAGNDNISYSGTLKLFQATREINGQPVRVWTVISQNFSASGY